MNEYVGISLQKDIVELIKSVKDKRNYHSVSDFIRAAVREKAEKIEKEELEKTKVLGGH